MDRADDSHFAESPEQFKKRTEEIVRIRKTINAGNAKAADVENLAMLLGTNDSHRDSDTPSRNAP